MINGEKSIIHISFDFPDIINSKKTKAVYNLVNAQKSYKNIVFSLNRTANPFADYSYNRELNGYSLNIFGLPFGIGLRLWMYFAYRKINKILLKENINVSIIHGHKLTFEGLIVKHLSENKRAPYIISVRGDTDIKLIKLLKFNRKSYLRILQDASQIIYLAPWTKTEVYRLFNGRLVHGKEVVLPNIIKLSDIAENQTENRFPDRFVSVFHLDSYKRKNIERTIFAMNEVHKHHPEIRLDIIGGGKSSKIIKSFISKCKYPERFKLLGPMDHQEVLNTYSKYLGLILPSFPETFGLVFVEALHAEIPVLYSENSGIDGYFDNIGISEKVKYNSVKEITTGIIKLYQQNENYRNSIKLFKKEDGFRKFNQKSVGNKYLSIISSTIQ